MIKTQCTALLFSFLFSISAFAAQIKCGDYVVENYETRSIQKLVNISSDGLYLLEDGQWYHPRYIQSLVSAYNNISVGQSVVENYETRSIQRVVSISSDGLYLLEDGQWYHPRYIQSLDCGSSSSCN